MQRHYGYSPAKTKAYMTVPGSRGINHSLVCTISINGVVAWETKMGHTRQRILYSLLKLILYHVLQYIQLKF
ncbi:hypothetical protein H312_03342 [Anncaliia algerae PRA339]|uniref:Uncharacterized protein n=1 Tax=Anncaliia algerae PRA339 TaxID=1288291 RepID=A0A059EWM0_9MICR|nr:hypothetical protein H312_03342 [Anncaliia algerae PRA339]